MRRTHRITLALLALLVATAACDLSRPVAPDTVLSDRAAVDAFNAMLRLDGFRIGFADYRPRNSGVGSNEAGLVLAMNRTEDCPEGGWTALYGQMVGDEATGLVGLAYEQSLSNCQVRSSANQLWRFHGDRGIRTSFVASYDTVSRTATITGNVQGTVNVVARGFDAICDVQFDIRVVRNVGRFVGTLCGVSVSEPYLPPR